MLLQTSGSKILSKQGITNSKRLSTILYNVLENNPTSVMIVQPLLLREMNVTHLTTEGIPITSQQKIKTRFCRPPQKYVLLCDGFLTAFLLACLNQCFGSVTFHTDPDPRKRTTGLRIRIRFFFSVALKMQPKNKFFFPPSFFACNLSYSRHFFISLQKEQVIKKSRKTVEIISYFFAWWWKNLNPDPCPNNLRIGDTGFNISKCRGFFSSRWKQVSY
jgi:hypothetical protein